MADRWDIICLDCDAEPEGCAFSGEGLRCYDEIEFLVAQRKTLAKVCAAFLPFLEAKAGASFLYGGEPEIVFSYAIGSLNPAWWAAHGDHELACGPRYRLDEVKREAREARGGSGAT